jgi:hypothetical protein
MAFKLELNRDTIDVRLSVEADLIEFEFGLENPIDDDLYFKILDKATELAEEIDHWNPICEAEYDDLTSSWNRFLVALVHVAADEVINNK